MDITRKRITKKNFIELLTGSSKVGFVYGGGNHGVDYLKRIEDNYEVFSKEENCACEWRKVLRYNSHCIVWNTGSKLDFDQWGSKTYWQIGRLVLQITEYDNGPQWDDFKSAVIYLLPDTNSKAA